MKGYPQLHATNVHPSSLGGGPLASQVRQRQDEDWMVIITTDYSRVPKVVATGSEPGNTFLVLVNQAIEPGEVCGAGTPDQLDAAYFLQCLENEWLHLAFKPVFEIQTCFFCFPQSFRCHVLIPQLFLCLLGPQKARPPKSPLRF